MTGDAAGYAAVLRERGVQAGDRVALLIRNEVAFPLTWLALARLGAAAVPVNISSLPATTGRPKGCVLPHRYWGLLAGSLVTEFPHLGEGDVMLTAQPFHYVDPQWN